MIWLTLVRIWPTKNYFFHVFNVRNYSNNFFKRDNHNFKRSKPLFKIKSEFSVFACKMYGIHIIWIKNNNNYINYVNTVYLHVHYRKKISGAQNEQFFKITVCSLKLKNCNLHYSFNLTNSNTFSVTYANVPLKIQAFCIMYRKLVKKIMHFP